MASAVSAAIPRNIPMPVAVKPVQPLGLTIKNALLGRLETWKDPIFVIGAVWHIFRAVFDLINGSIFLFVVSSVTAVVLANTRRLLHDFANFRKENLEYKRQNLQHMKLNFQHSINNKEQKKTIDELKKHVEKLSSEINRLAAVTKRIEDANEITTYNNAVFRLHLDTLEGTIKNLDSSIRATLESGNQVSREILQGFLNSVAFFEEQKESLHEIAAQIREENSAMKAENSATLKKFEHVAAHMKKVNDDVFESLDREIQSRVSKLDLTTQVLDQTTQDLIDVRKQFQKEREKLGKTVDDVALGNKLLLKNIRILDGQVSRGLFSWKNLLYSRPSKGEELDPARPLAIAAIAFIAVKYAYSVYNGG